MCGGAGPYIGDERPKKKRPKTVGGGSATDANQSRVRLGRAPLSSRLMTRPIRRVMVLAIKRNGRDP